MLPTLWVLCVVAAVLAPAQNQAASRQKAQSIPVDQTPQGRLHFWLYLPPGYEQQEAKRWPLLLFLHGAGERGSDLRRVLRHGPPKLIAAGRQFPFIVVSPQCPGGTNWRHLAPSLLRLLDHMEKNYRVDRSRVYVTGLSMGGFGTWHLLGVAPDRFAAAVPICGGGDPQVAPKAKHVPVWAFHGAKDRVVPLKRSEEMVQAWWRAGGKARLTVYPHAGHDSWTKTYANPDVYRWLLQHRKVAR